jgi:hypothetical protein
MIDPVRNILGNSMNLPAKLYALGVLRSPEVEKIEFTMPYVAVGKNTFQKVRDNILIDKIMVVLMSANDPEAQNGDGVYMPGPNLMKLGKLDATNVSPRAVVVHESVHAALDIDQPNKPVTVLYAEASAYTAEAIFRRHLNATTSDPSRRPPSFIHHEDKDMDNIRKAAWDMALKCVDDGKLEFSEKDGVLLDLLHAIQNAPLYINESPFWEFFNADGV